MALERVSFFIMNTDKPKTSENRQKKEVLVAEYSEKLEKAKGLVFTNYQGLTHHQLEALKRGLKKVDAEFVATKNTLIKIALKDKAKDLDEHFNKPTGVLFIYNDIIEPLKLLAKTIKEFTLPVVKIGLLEGKIITDKEIAKLATLAPLPVLRAQLLGQMKAPISGLHRSLNWNLQKLVMTLNAIKDKKA